MSRYSRLVGMGTASWVSRTAWGAAVVVVVALTFFHSMHVNQHWDADSFLYTRMMLVDTGMSQEAAYSAASHYYLSTPEARDPRMARLVGTNPPRFFRDEYSLFRARTLVPYLGSRLYPWLHFHALSFISALSIAVAAGALYALLLLVAPPWLAGCGALAATAWPTVRDVGTVGGTDALALAEWTICLYAIAQYARKPSASFLVLSIFGAGLLAATRPAVWLPIGATGALVMRAYLIDGKARRAVVVLLVTQLALGMGAVAYTYAIHGAGIIEQLRWQYEYHREGHGHWVEYGIVAWYLLYVVRSTIMYSWQLIETGAGPLTVTVGALGIWRIRTDPIAWVCAGVASVAPLAILLNPQDVTRALELPLVPVFTLGICALLALALPQT